MGHRVLVALVAAVAMTAGGPAAAQSAQPAQPPAHRTPIDEAPPNRSPVTSGERVAKPASAADQREAKALATAVFGKPAAAHKAAKKAEVDTPLPVAPIEPKPEWADKGLRPGGKGVKATKPF
jgi:hypothetical protein